MSPTHPEPATGAAGRSLSIDQLTELRAKTEAVSQLLRKRLEGHLATMRVAFAPRWVLGKHVRSGIRADDRSCSRASSQTSRSRSKACSNCTRGSTRSSSAGSRSR
jgi:hypothetical protein